MQPPDLSEFTHAQKDALILQLFEQIALLQQEVKELKARSSMNSGNSSKPPSSDGYDKPKPKSRRKSNGRTSGGQRGHKGSTLRQSEHPDDVTDHQVDHCAHCGFGLGDILTEDYEARQVFDIPPIKIRVNEHRAHIKQCPCCQKRTKADFPANVTQPVQYGPRVQATATYLSQYQLVPYKRQAELFHDLFNLSLSQGTLDNILQRAHGHLAEFEGASRQCVIHSHHAHFDETGLRVLNQLYWLHVASTDSVTCYMIHPRRGQVAMKQMGVLDEFKGYAVHDHLPAYFMFAVLHVLCGAHLLRELIYALEQHEQRWAGKMIQCLLDAKEEADAAIIEGLSHLDESRITAIEKRYDRVLNQGQPELPVLAQPAANKPGRAKQHKAKNLHDRLVSFKPEILAFVYDLTLPFDNNQAERDVRPGKVKQKISGSFRSELGAQMFARIRGYISTAKKQGRNVFDALSDAFDGRAFDPAKPPEPLTG